jgi:hypothetical protein
MSTYSHLKGKSLTAIYSTAADLPLTDVASGAKAYVTETHRLYLWNGTGWYNIALINTAPTITTEAAATYTLASDGTATVITLVATDPEGVPITWSHSVTTGTLGSTAVVTQSANVFTVTPSSTAAGTFSLTFTASDGINVATSTSAFTLSFVVTNSQYTTLLATAVSTGDNNNITDASSSNHTITVAGDTHAGTFSPYRHGGYSVEFDGAGDYLTTPANTAFEFGTGDFTMELSFYRPAGGSVDSLLQYGNAAVSLWTHVSWALYITSSNYLSFEISDGTGSGTGNLVLLSNVLFPTSSWVHVSVVRDGNSFKVYQNGNAVAATTDSRSAYVSSSPLLWIARNHSGGSGDCAGLFSNVRIVKGTAVYTANFTPPTEPLTAITNTSLLTCHLPYIADGSSNAHAITVNGNASATTFNMYDYAEYSEATHGGSVYFNGTTDYLQSAANSDFQFGTSDFTVEVWVYFEALPSESSLLTKWNAGGTAGTNQWILYIADSTPSFVWSTDGSSGIGVTGPNLALNSWHHLAAVRNGSSITLYVNGVPGTSGSVSGSLYGSETELLGIGYRRDNNTGTPKLTGYISDIRIVKGTAVYTAAFTPPTAPLSSSGSSLHIKGTDASIIDKSQVSKLKLVGNTTGSTTQVKFTDTKSMYFDGTDDYLRVGSNKDILNSLINNDNLMTIESWVYPTISRSGSHTGESPSILSIGNTYLSIGLDSLTPFFYWWTGSQNTISSSNAVTLNAWSHIAVVLDANSGTNNIKIYINGTLDGQGTFSGISWASGAEGDQVKIGKGHTSADAYFQGYIQDFRVTKDLARYTANFTPPTAPLTG